jgi:4-hydroxy 2-oxovalerate aldolase
MTEDDVAYYFTRFDKGLESSICIGFHAHNNMGMAFANVRSFIKMHGERQIIVDSCADGMGQGAGNMQTEVLMDYLNRFYGKRYSIDRIYDVCEVVEHFNVNRLWGYAPARFISAANGTAYKYADALRRKYGLEMREINHILKVIPEEMRYRFTEENMEKLLTLYYGKGDKVEI